MFVASKLTVPPTGLPTAVSVSVWPLSLVPAVSLASNEAILIVRWPESSATVDSESLLAAGLPLTSVTVNLTVAVLLFGLGRPLVVPLSVMVYWKLFFFNDPATTEIYTLSLHDALPISTGLPTAVSVSVWPLSLVPAVSLASNEAILIVRWPESSATVD